MGAVVFDVTTERRSTPLTTVAAVFSSIEDAGKYLVWKLADSLRIACREDPIFWRWRAAGLDSRIEKGLPSDDMVRLIAQLNQVEAERTKSIRSYQIRQHPDVYAVLREWEEPRSRVLILTYAELDSQLIEGLQ
jgi:hypothetical protein